MPVQSPRISFSIIIANASSPGLRILLKMKSVSIVVSPDLLAVELGLSRLFYSKNFAVSVPGPSPPKGVLVLHRIAPPLPSV